MKIAVIGASGFIGEYLWKFYHNIDPDTIGTCFSKNNTNLLFFDLAQPDIRTLGLAEKKCDAVIIASAKPNISYCENNPQASREVNVIGTTKLIEQIASLSIKVVFLSTDYVFDGNKGQYADNAVRTPSTLYGQQKDEIEKTIPQITDNFLTLRLSKIYGLKKNDGTLLDEIASKLIDQKPIKLATDQYFSPTNVNDVISATDLLLSADRRGTYNLARPIRVSRHEVGLALAASLNADESLITPISLHDIEAMKNRPLDTSLLPAKLLDETDFNFKPLAMDIDLVSQNWLGY